MQLPNFLKPGTLCACVSRLVAIEVPENGDTMVVDAPNRNIATNGTKAKEADMRKLAGCVRLVVSAYICIGVLANWPTAAAAQCLDLTLPGPSLVNNVTNWPDSGLVLVPHADISLKSFRFNNQGLADTVYLVRASDGTVLYSRATPSGATSYTVNVDWDLLKGETYRLLSADGSNGRWVGYTAFPTSNTNVSVSGTWGSGSLQSNYWFTFTHLRTTCSVCTPSTVPGPSLTSNITGWPDSGLSLTATANTRLRSFRFNNQGEHDTVKLVRESDGAVLYAVTTPQSEVDYVAVVDWSLLAGETYHLVSADPSNGRYAAFTDWPSVSGDLIINGTWGSGGIETNYWFTFTDLQTKCGPCPFDSVRGVTFTNNVSGWPNSGLSITADVDTVLRRFTFNNQGLADTVSLVRESDSVVIGSLSTPAGETTYEAIVTWPMSAGVTYHLISQEGSNGRHDPYSSWPLTNSMVTVNGAWYGSALSTGYWFTFTELLMTSDCGLFDFDFETADLFLWSTAFGADCGGWMWDGACWYTASAVDMTCNEVCATRGGFDSSGSIHTGNRVGIHYWPEKVFGSNWTNIECSSVDNNTNWGATGATADGDWSHPACHVNCACIR